MFAHHMSWHPRRSNCGPPPRMGKGSGSEHVSELSCSSGKQGRRADALRCLKHCKLMKSELKDIPAESEAAQPAAAAGAPPGYSGPQLNVSKKVYRSDMARGVSHACRSPTPSAPLLDPPPPQFLSSPLV